MHQGERVMSDKVQSNDAVHNQPLQLSEHTWLHDQIQQAWNNSMHQLENKFPNAAKTLQYFEVGGAAATQINEAVRASDGQNQNQKQQQSLDSALKFDIYANK
jgi:hypothetical protein